MARAAAEDAEFHECVTADMAALFEKIAVSLARRVIVGVREG